MRDVYITNHHIISPLGFDSASNFKNLLEGKSGIKKHIRKNGDSYYSSQVDKSKVDKAFLKIANK